MLARRSPFARLLSSRTGHAFRRGGFAKLGPPPRRHKSSTTQVEDAPVEESSQQASHHDSHVGLHDSHVGLHDSHPFGHRFAHHKYVDFFRDESMSVGIVSFRSAVHGKKNILGDFLEELKNVVEHITNVMANEETNTFYIKEFPRGDNYLVQNMRNRIPYVDNRLKVLILTGGNEPIGSGEASMSGSTPDYNSFLKNDEQLNVQLANSFRYLCNTIQHLPLITISSINGQCHNSGMDLLLSTDFKLSSEESTFGFNKAHLGLLPYGGGTQKLFRAIPMSYAKHLLLTGDTIRAKDALRINLIDICMGHNEDHFVQNSCVHFDANLAKKEKMQIIKESVGTFFADVFSNELFKDRVKDSCFVFSLFFAFQFLFIPTNALQNVKMSILEGMSLAEPNLYLDHDRAVFERNINAPQRAEILAYLKRRVSGAPSVPT
ncbi:enoyl-CoA hydratase, putative [Plasmodium vivax]|uniref:Enoyl-CoA hydratase, putative n=1 Tax=Plasmodium vivax TaxID=5855 RepID=A0A1G4H3C7_PLAVI|nr:enoyl-CoA hydratase, putative [Plasmodium vivax]